MMTVFFAGFIVGFLFALVAIAVGMIYQAVRKPIVVRDDA